MSRHLDLPDADSDGPYERVLHASPCTTMTRGTIHLDVGLNPREPGRGEHGERKVAGLNLSRWAALQLVLHVARLLATPGDHHRYRPPAWLVKGRENSKAVPSGVGGERPS